MCGKLILHKVLIFLAQILRFLGTKGKIAKIKEEQCGNLSNRNEYSGHFGSDNRCSGGIGKKDHCNQCLICESFEHAFFKN